MAAVSESATGKVYLVDYDENLFLSYNQEGQDFCFETWAKKAAPMGCDMVVLRLHPDQWFPMHGHDKPYIFKQVPIAGEKPALFRTKSKFYVELTAEWNKLPEHEQLAVRQQAREAGMRSGCDAWEVWYGHTHKLDSGYNNQKGQHGVGRG